MHGHSVHGSLKLTILKMNRSNKLMFLHAGANSGKLKPSVMLSVCLGVFLELDHQVSLNFALMLETLIMLYMTELNFLEKLLPQKLGK